MKSQKIWLVIALAYYTKTEKKSGKLNTVEEIYFSKTVQMKNVFIPI